MKTYSGKLIALGLLAVGIVSAVPITHNGTPDNSTTTSIVGITGFSTTGADMAGMQVTVTFGNFGVATCTWAATGPSAGGCYGAVPNSFPDFTISLDGDSFTSNWQITSTGTLMTQIVINALAGGIVFDIVSTDPLNSTPGSSNGAAISGDSLQSPAVGGYSNRVQVGANPAVGDLYGVLTITFDGGGTAVANFLADTDSVGLPGGGDVPEPSSIALLLGGVALLAWKRSRR